MDSVGAIQRPGWRTWHVRFRIGIESQELEEARKRKAQSK